MRVRSLRLCNVKSFGTGPTGRGWRVELEPGLNRICGPNGVGKTTLIEALGYALFDARPDGAPRLDLDVLLLRHGADAGEIEVLFDAAGETWRVTRTLGAALEPGWKLFSNDPEPSASGDDAVRARLGELLGAKKSGDDALAGTFRRLIAVRQGKLLEPLDSGPSEARRHFAPLLDLEVYATCQEAFKDAAAHLREQQARAEGQARAARGLVDNLAQAGAQGAALEQRLAECEAALSNARAALARAGQEQAQWEARERTIHIETQKLNAARKDVESGEAALTAKRELLDRAEKAHAVLEAHAKAHAAHQEAEAVLKQAADRREETIQRQERIATLRAEQQQAAAKADLSAERAKTARAEVELLAVSIAAAKGLQGERRKELERAESEGEKTLATPGLGPEHEAALERLLQWAAGLEHAALSASRCGQSTAELNRELAGFDAGAVVQANGVRDAFKPTLDAARKEFAELDAKRKVRRELVKSLEDARHCPLLNERCKQFDPGRAVLAEVKLDELFEHSKARLVGIEKQYEGLERAANEAHKVVEGAEAKLRRAEAALSELGYQIEVSNDAAGRSAFLYLAKQTQTQVLLPALPDLPDPAKEPWVALAAAQGVAESFAAFARAIVQTAQTWKRAADERRKLQDELRQRGTGHRATLAAEEKTIGERIEELERRRQACEQFELAAREDWAAKNRAADNFAEATRGGLSVEDMEGRTAQAQRQKEASEAGYLAYVAAEPDARRLSSARAESAIAYSRLQEARTAAAQALSAREAALTTYDAEVHARARAALEKSAVQVRTLESELLSGQARLARLKEEAAAVAKAVTEAGASAERAERLDAQRVLLEHARKTLHEAGPRIAERLVHAVTARAQSIYNALSPDEPGLLDWHADFELRVATYGGLRRFAMLSGGQKAKAALALHLALVRQFSRAGLLILDEPTYGLDEDARGRLAQALVEAQRAVDFEQLIVVSHDDAFDGLVEHAVRLEYSPSLGTQVR